VLYVLVPPSEGKAEGGTGRWQPASGAFGRRLRQQRTDVVEALGRTTLGETKLGATGALFARAAAANQAVAAGKGRKLAAHQRYTGVVWEHLDPASLEDETRKRILVPSALLGLVTAADPVPDHRLKFDVSLDGIGRLDRFWRAHLTDAIKKHTTRHDTIVELLPQEHTAAIDLDAVAKRRAVIRTTVAGVSGHDAKAVKGALARHLLRHGIDTPFDWRGWRADLDPLARSIVVSR
jgi:uncharacterized protein